MHDRHPSQLREFLAQRLGLDKRDVPEAGAWAGSGNTIGSIALRLGVLGLEQIEQIVDLQVARDSRFGDTAVELGHLTREQVDRLVALQELHRCVDLAGPLALNGQVELSDLLTLLAEFLAD